MVQISLLAHKFRVKIKKKGLRRDILGLILAYTRVFCPETKHYSRLGGHRPQNALQWHRVCYFLSGRDPRLGGTILAWGHTSRLGGTSDDLGGYGPEKPPVAPGLTSSSELVAF